MVAQLGHRHAPGVEPYLLNGGDNRIVRTNAAQWRIDEIHAPRPVHRLSKADAEIQHQLTMRALSATLENKRESLRVRWRGEVDQVQRVAPGDRAQIERIRLVLRHIEPVSIGGGNAVPRFEKDIGRRRAVLSLNGRAEARENTENEESH